jgi:hypothetical protein
VGDLPGIYVRMNAEMYEEVVALADDLDCSMAEVGREALAFCLGLRYMPIVRGRKKVG